MSREKEEGIQEVKTRHETACLRGSINLAERGDSGEYRGNIRCHERMVMKDQKGGGERRVQDDMVS